MSSSALKSLSKDRLGIARKVRALRRERRWSQAELARKLGLSQSRLSEIENGGGSFSAEQFLLLLRLFNVGLSHFSSERREVDAELQNALARLGADHLQEVPDLLPSERLEEATEVIREAVITGRSRHLTGVAAVLVRAIDSVDLRRLRGELARLGFARRFQWLLENVAAALRIELEASPPRVWAQRYRRSLVVIETALDFAAETDDPRHEPVDLLDEHIRSKETLHTLSLNAPLLSQKWRVASTLAPEDFASALRAARAG